MQAQSTITTQRKTLMQSVRKVSRLLGFTGVALVASSLVITSPLAKGKKPEDVYKGQIILSDRPFPTRFKSNDHFVQHMKSVRQGEFWPSTQDGPWQIEYMAFFAKPLPSHTYSVVYFDVTDKNKPIFVTEGTSTPQKDGLRIMAGFAELKPPHFQPDHRYLILYTPNVNQPALAEAEFVLRPFDPRRAAEARERRDALLREQHEAEQAEKEKQAKDKAPAWEPPNW